ncbi:DUF4386 domain-containing protein [Stackebrandtia endophytica]|uniref:DUF4386 domain-containing protein n=1 Tax=Stackebrandtia endophytica TaxID=1496996 RepID=UPI00115304E4|nr:DUF4386 domain-containing protein [Stackebrandtia endophytica]
MQQGRGPPLPVVFDEPGAGVVDPVETSEAQQRPGGHRLHGRGQVVVVLSTQPVDHIGQTLLQCLEVAAAVCVGESRERVVIGGSRQSLVPGAVAVLLMTFGGPDQPERPPGPVFGFRELDDPFRPVTDLVASPKRQFGNDRSYQRVDPFGVTDTAGPVDRGLYPVLGRHGRAVALGYLAARILEVVTILPTAVAPLLVMTLNAPGHRELVLGAQHQVLPASTVFFCLSVVLLNTLLYRTGLVPRWISGWALVGGGAVPVEWLAGAVRGDDRIVVALRDPGRPVGGQRDGAGGQTADSRVSRRGG